MNYDHTVTVSLDGQWYDFAARKTNSGLNITDKIVLREIFHENVYQIEEGMFNDSGIAIDIGANIGAFSIFAAGMGAKKVYAYEPEEGNFGVLKTNIKQNNLDKVIKAIDWGVLDERRDVELYGGQGASFVEGVKTLTGAAKKMIVNKETARQTIKCVSLESVFADNKVSSCDVLKIDVEGSEYEIIAGAKPEILAKAKFITMEFHNADEQTFGLMIAKLTKSHNLHIIGKHDEGGQIYGYRY